MNKLLLAAGWGVLLAVSWPLLAAGDEPPAVTQLIEKLRQPDVTARPKTAGALGTYGAAARHAVPNLGKMLRQENNHAPSLAATQALARIGAAAVPELVLSLKHPAPIVRSRAAWALGMIGPDADEAVPGLITALGDRDKQVRQQAAYALGEVGPKAKAAVGPLAALLRDPMVPVRQQAAASLRGIGAAAVPALMEALQDKGAATREEAAHALALLGPDAREAVAALAEAAHDKHAGTRIQVIAAQAGIGPEAKTAAPALFEALKVKHVETQARAAAALLAIGAGTDDELAATMRRITRKVRWATPPVLVQFGRRPKDAVRPLILALKEDDPNQRAAAAVALGNIGRDAKEAVPALRKALNDKEVRVRLSAAGALPLIDDATHKQAAQAFERALAEMEKRQKALEALLQAKADPDLRSYYREVTGNLIVAMSTLHRRTGKLQELRLGPGNVVIGVDAQDPETHVGLLHIEPFKPVPGDDLFRSHLRAAAAVPALVHGANLIAARGLGFCEPMASVLTHLRSAVYTSGMPEGFCYTIQNVGNGVLPQSAWWPTFQTMRQQLLNDLVGMSRGRPPRFAPPPKALQDSEQAIPGQGAPQQNRPLSRREFLVREQLGELLRGLHDRQELLDGLFQQMVRQDPEEIKGRLADKEADIRLVAVQVVADRRLHFEDLLIDLLNDDPSPDVQAAAHQALVRLSRGNDFGPTPTAGPAGRPRRTQGFRRNDVAPAPKAGPVAKASAIRAWQQWLLWQDIPGQPSPQWLAQNLRRGPADLQDWLLAQLRDWPREDAMTILARTIPLLAAVPDPAGGSQGAVLEQSAKADAAEAAETQQRLRQALGDRLSQQPAEALNAS